MFWKRQRETRSFYEGEKARMRKKLGELDVGSPEYVEISNRLNTLTKIYENDSESSRRISKADKGGLMKAIAGGAMTMLIGFGVSKFEADGHIFTGQKKNFISTLINMVKNLGIIPKG